jgi:nucleoid-associated protein YgaU
MADNPIPPTEAELEAQQLAALAAHLAALESDQGAALVVETNNARPDIYVIQPGDSLDTISERWYGDASRVADILALNSNLLGSDPGKVIVGAQIALPE